MNNKREDLTRQVEILKKTREATGLNRKEFSEYMGIPLRSLEEWEAGRRKMPEYLLRLISYYIVVNRYFKDQGIEPEELYESINDIDMNLKGSKDQ